MPPLEAPLALRYWPEFTEQKPEGTGSRRGKKWRGRLTRIGERVLVFDTETTADEVQSLRFGFFRLYVNEACEREGLFVADDLEARDPEGFRTTQAFAHRFGLEFLTRAVFVEGVFYPEVKALGALVVGFNLPFDLSRIAVKCTAGRGRYRDCFSFKLSDSLFHPWVRIQPLNAHSSSIRFLKAKRSKFRESKPFDGRFLDLHTVCYALSQESHSLRSAGEAFAADTLKEQVADTNDEDGHGGPITADYLNYARRDVDATYSLYLAVSDAYSRFPFASSDPEEQRGADDTPITDLYSPASIAKAMFRKMRLEPALLPPQYLGYAMSAFFGPRVEVRIRNKEVPATLLDFTSQYPAVFTLLDLWLIATAKRVEPEEDADRVRSLLARIAASPETLFDKATWKELAGYAQVVPNGDFLPCRVNWPDGSQPSLSVCPITAEQPLWYALPDLAASVLLTGKVPHILQAFRAKAHGVQSKLCAVTLEGSRLDPRDPAFFARVVEHRKRLEARGEKALAAGVKGLANTGSYGVFAEFNVTHIPPTREVGGPEKRKQSRRRDEAIIYSNTTFAHAFRRTVEKAGPFTNPYLASLVTAGGRLLMAMAEREAGSFAWIATDAIAVVSGDPAAMQAKFQRLSPYEREVIPRFLKREESGIAYALSSNRYCLRLPDGSFHKASQHGMSGILPPEGQRMSVFAEEVWLAILSGQVPQEWGRVPLRRRLPIRSPGVWGRVREVIPEARPFGFLLSASSPKELPFALDEESGTFYGPYRRDVKGSLKAKWLNTRTGKKTRLEVCPPDDYRYDAPAKGHVYCASVLDFLDSFRSHRDAKMTGSDEALTPVPVQVSSLDYVGKETDRIRMEGRNERLKQGNRRLGHVLTTGQRNAIQELKHWPPSRVASELGITDRFLRQLFRGERTPSPAVANRLYGLYQSLPREVPPTFRERCEAVRLAAERMVGG